MITTQTELRKQFKAAHPDLDYKTIPSPDGKGRMYKADTRISFCFFVDDMNKDGQISDTLAERATFEPRQPKRS